MGKHQHTETGNVISVLGTSNIQKEIPEGKEGTDYQRLFDEFIAYFRQWE